MCLKLSSSLARRLRCDIYLNTQTTAPDLPTASAEAGMSFTGTRFNTTPFDGIPRLNGGSEYVSYGVQNGASMTNAGESPC